MSYASRLKSMLVNLTNALSPRLSFSLSYYRHRRRWPDLKNPKNLSEIIGAQMVSGEINRYSELADKVKVRDYLAEWGFGEYLPALLNKWIDVNSLSINDLPEKFVLKTNHGCGSNFICTDKKTFDLEKVKGELDSALHRRYGSRETQYHAIEPCVFAEEYIYDGKNELPVDYKFICVDGRIKGVLVCLDRKQGIRLALYDENWNRLDFIQGPEKTETAVECPPRFEEMKRIAQCIGARFPQVRVDMYNCNGKIYIGELTFTAQGGILSYMTMEGLEYLGRS